MQSLDIIQIIVMPVITIAAIFLGPRYGIYAQKQLEKNTEHESKQHDIFRTLMATRANRLSIKHVEALNLISMDFSENKENEQPIIAAWENLLDQYNDYPVYSNYDDKAKYSVDLQISEKESSKYLVELLSNMSKCLGYGFKKIDIKNGCYAPVGHSEKDNDDFLIRRGLVGVLQGYLPLSVNVKDSPVQTPN